MACRFSAYPGSKSAATRGEDDGELEAPAHAPGVLGRLDRHAVAGRP